jgi:hypothetical protein
MILIELTLAERLFGLELDGRNYQLDFRERSFGLVLEDRD